MNKRSSDVTQNAKLVGDMLTGEVPNDKDEVLEPRRTPEGRQRSRKARAAALTLAWRRELAQQAATARRGG